MDIAKYIDYTNVKATATKKDIEKFCWEAKKYGFFAVCVNPTRVNLAKKLLKKSGIKVASVVGFPLGANSTKIKVEEAKEAVKSGADEIDMVINIGSLKDKNYQYFFKDIKSVIQAAKNRPVKAILEVSLLTEREIKTACQMAKKAGARFLKTGTGFGPRGVKLSDIKLMRRTAKNEIGIKASGGIKSYRKALAMIKAGADRVGTSHGAEIMRNQPR